MRATIVTDLGFGDAGKGSIVDYLARTQNARLVVRHNGGAQAAHNVVAANGQHHTFRQFGSGTLVPGTHTYLSRFMLVDPLGLQQEAEALGQLGVGDAYDRITIDRRALLVTPYHQAANRLRELARGDGRHGSCGAGIGEAMADAVSGKVPMLTAADFTRPLQALAKLETIRRHKIVQMWEIMGWLADNPLGRPEIVTLNDPGLSRAVVDFYVWLAGRVQVVDETYLPQALRATEHTVFEGAQGVLLDEWHGFHPYTTWSTTTTANADALLKEVGHEGSVTRLGLLRAYATRHGAGPFPTEDPGLSQAIPDLHNGSDGWQGGFRVGYFDAVAARYALEVAGPIDGLVITNLDRLYGQLDWRMATAYHTKTGRTTRLVPSHGHNLKYQEALTVQLLGATPEYETVCPGVFTEHSIPAYCEAIADRLGRPVVLRSSGPRAEDKSA